MLHFAASSQVVAVAVLAAAFNAGASAILKHAIESVSSDLEDAVPVGTLPLQALARALVRAACSTWQVMQPVYFARAITQKQFCRISVLMCAIFGASVFMVEVWGSVSSQTGSGAVATDPIVAACKSLAYCITTVYSGHHVAISSDVMGVALKWAGLWWLTSVIQTSYLPLLDLAISWQHGAEARVWILVLLCFFVNPVVSAVLKSFARHVARSVELKGGSLSAAALLVPFHFLEEVSCWYLTILLAHASSGTADTDNSLQSINPSIQSPGKDIHDGRPVDQSVVAPEVVRLLAIHFIGRSMFKIWHRSSSDTHLLSVLFGSGKVAEAVLARPEEDEVIVSSWLAELVSTAAVILRNQGIGYVPWHKYKHAAPALYVGPDGRGLGGFCQLLGVESSTKQCFQSLGAGGGLSLRPGANTDPLAAVKLPCSLLLLGILVKLSVELVSFLMRWKYYAVDFKAVWHHEPGSSSGRSSIRLLLTKALVVGVPLFVVGLSS